MTDKDDKIVPATKAETTRFGNMPDLKPKVEGARVNFPDFEIEVTKIEAKPRKLIGWSVHEVTPEENAKTPDYDADILEDTTEADTYRHRHHKHYEAPGQRGYTSHPVLQQLNGRPWDQFALNMVHTLRPSYIRVSIGGGGTLDAVRWRVTVALEEDDRTIKEITQEVEVGCVGAKHGHGLYKYEIGESPRPAMGYYNPKGLERLKIKR